MDQEKNSKPGQRVFFVASTNRGQRVMEFAFGEKCEKPIEIATRAYNKSMIAPMDVLMVFESADDYFLDKMPIAFKLSPAAIERAKGMRCFQHRRTGYGIADTPVMSGLPGCRKCRDEILVTAGMPMV